MDLTVLWVALGAAVGAPARYLVDRTVQARHDSLFPWGTLAVNVAGSFVLGGIAGAGSRVDAAVAAGLGIGFCGAFTTYSTFGYETLRLLSDRARLFAVANVVISLGAGFGALLLGWLLTSALV